MARVRSGFARCSSVVLLLASCGAGTAVGQNTVNQTTCGGVSGVDGCLTGGFLQDLTVDCQAGFPANQVDTALAQITDRNGPNRITLSGSGCGGVGIVGFNRLTIVGDGSPVGGFWSFVNSRNILLKSITYDFNVQTGNLNMQGSEVTFDGVTVKNSPGFAGDSAVGLVGSDLGFAGAPSLITNNSCVGISVDSASHLNVANVTISNNGLGSGCGGQRHGIRVRGGSVNLANQIRLNGVITDSPVDISGNGKNGIAMEGGTLTEAAESGNAVIRIHDNVDTGLEVGGGATADVEGHLQFDNNHMGGNDPFFPGPLQIVAVFGGSLGIGGGVSVQGGLAGAFNASLLIGSGGPMSITGGAFFRGGSVALMGGANTIDSLSCDATSWVLNFDNQSNVQTNLCPSAGPQGTGLLGREVVNTSVPVTLRRGASSTVTATCSGSKVVIGGGASVGNPSFAVVSSGPSGASAWSVRVRNAGARARGDVGATAICAVAQ